jgi:uncharacterized membrane protein
MSPEWITLLTASAAVGSGLVAGVFFAFSTFVMRALSRLPPSQGISAMQAINVAAPNPWFMAAMFGTAIVCAVLAVHSVLNWREPGAQLRLAGSLLYIAGVVGVTIALNIPLNDALAAVVPEGAESAVFWARYLIDWGLWNHVRTVTALLAAVSFTIALISRARS